MVQVNHFNLYYADRLKLHFLLFFSLPFSLILSVVDIIDHARRHHRFSNLLLSEIPSKMIRERNGVLYPISRAGMREVEESELHMHGPFQATFCICNCVFFFLEECPQNLDPPSNKIQTKILYAPENKKCWLKYILIISTGHHNKRHICRWVRTVQGGRKRYRNKLYWSSLLLLGADTVQTFNNSTNSYCVLTLCQAVS